MRHNFAAHVPTPDLSGSGLSGDIRDAFRSRVLPGEITAPARCNSLRHPDAAVSLRDKIQRLFVRSEIQKRNFRCRPAYSTKESPLLAGSGGGETMRYFLLLP